MMEQDVPALSPGVSQRARAKAFREFLLRAFLLFLSAMALKVPKANNIQLFKEGYKVI